MVRGLPLRLMNLQMSSLRGKAEKGGDIALLGALSLASAV